MAKKKEKTIITVLELLTAVNLEKFVALGSTLNVRNFYANDKEADKFLKKDHTIITKASSKVLKKLLKKYKRKQGFYSIPALQYGYKDIEIQAEYNSLKTHLITSEKRLEAIRNLKNNAVPTLKRGEVNMTIEDPLALDDEKGGENVERK